MTYIMYTDGSAKDNVHCPTPTYIGVLCFDEHLNEVFRIYGYTGDGTNNTAEVEALIRGLEECSRRNIDDVWVYTDSTLAKGYAINRKKKNPTKINPELVRLHNHLHEEVLPKFKSFKIDQIPRAQNGLADSLSKIHDTREVHVC